MARSQRRRFAVPASHRPLTRTGGCSPHRTGLHSKFPAIPGLRDDPKIVGRDDAKVVGDSVAEAVPFFGNSSPEEAQDCRSELREGFIASVIGDMFVHYSPASFDRIKMRTIGRDEVRPDPASRLPQPLTHQNRVRAHRKQGLTGLAISAESAHIGKMSKDRATLRVEVESARKTPKSLQMGDLSGQ
jgi:hypothetical protein